jgi:hypothetical protein
MSVVFSGLSENAPTILETLSTALREETKQNCKLRYYMLRF